MKNYRLNCYQIIKQMIKIFVPILSKHFYSYPKRPSTTRASPHLFNKNEARKRNSITIEYYYKSANPDSFNVSIAISRPSKDQKAQH